MKKMVKIRWLFTNRELRKRLLLTAFILLAIRCLTQLSVPFVDIGMLKAIFRMDDSFSFFNMITGGGIETFSVFSLSISPYITASILLQLGAIIFPSLEELQKDGESGRKVITKYTQRVSLILSIFQAIGVAYSLEQMKIIMGGSFPLLIITLTLTAGTAILMWLGNIITEYGVGNGLSLILLMNVLSRMPKDLTALFDQFVKDKGVSGVLIGVLIIAIIVIVAILTIMVNEAVRKIPIQYANKLNGRRQKDEYIPLKMNTGSVMPVIFASSLLSVPGMITSFTSIVPKGWIKPWYYASMQDNWFVPDMWKLSIGYVFYIIMLIFFSYFYTEMSFNPTEVANGLKRSGASIPGVRPGVSTENYLTDISKPLILIGAVALAVVCTIPMVLSGLFGAKISFGGTSLIIIVSTLVETSKQLQLYIVEEKELLF